MEGESTFSDMVEVILAITFLYYSYNTIMPRVSYIKAMDVYLGACFIFVFLSLIKLAILKLMRLHGSIDDITSPRRRSSPFMGNSPIGRILRHNRLNETSLNEAKRSLEETGIDQEDECFLIENRKAIHKRVHHKSTGRLLGRENGSRKRSHVVSPSAGADSKKAPCRSPLFYSHLSLDTSARYKRAELRKSANEKATSTVSANGTMDRVRELFTRNRLVRNESFATRAIRFRKLYKKVWIILYPIAFFGFCVFYFFAYFLNADHKSLKKCEF